MNDFNYNNDDNRPVIIPERGPSAKPPKKKSNFMKYAGVCMACAVLSSSITGVGVYSLVQNNNRTTQQQSSAEKTDKNSVASSSKLKKTSSTGEALSASEIYDKASQEVVSITTKGTATNMFGQQSETEGAGTGFVVTEDGYIVTNYHVISSAVSSGSEISVKFHNGDTYDAEYIGGDSENDIALLKIDAEGLQPVTIGDSNDMQVGDDVCVVGNALGTLSNSLTSGLISALDRELDISSDNGQTTLMNMFQIDAAVNAGNSGGPVYNAKGEVIGIVTAKYSSSGVEGLGFAIPINDIVSMVEDIMENGYVTGKPKLGATVETVDATVSENYDIPQGAYIQGVEEGSAAAEAGLQAKDVITKLGDTEITSSSDLRKALKNYSAGDSEKITVYRSGSYKEFTVTFKEKEQTSSESDAQSGEQDSGEQQDGNSQQDSYNQYNNGNQGGGQSPNLFDYFR